MNEKLKTLDIKLLILDVDGVLTDGKLYCSNDGIETKCFHVRDGIGLKLLMKNNLEIAIISGRKSQATQNRMNDLGIKHIYLGISNKVESLNELKEKLSLQSENIAYIGDDIPDMPVMKEVGFSIAVNDASQEIIDLADYTLKTKGGQGAVREACELILSSKI